MNLYKLMDFAFRAAVLVFVVLVITPFKMITIQIMPIAVTVMLVSTLTEPINFKTLPSTFTRFS